MDVLLTLPLACLLSFKLSAMYKCSFPLTIFVFPKKSASPPAIIPASFSEKLIFQRGNSSRREWIVKKAAAAASNYNFFFKGFRLHRTEPFSVLNNIAGQCVN